MDGTVLAQRSCVGGVMRTEVLHAVNGTDLILKRFNSLSARTNE